MATITDRSSKQSVLKTGRLNHGTLHCRDIAKTRRFYEEVLGLDVVQTSPVSLMVRKGTPHVYAVVEIPDHKFPEMNMLNHNGLEVDGPADVDEAFEKIKSIKDEYEIKKIVPPRPQHGDYSFYLMDADGNWWEIVSVANRGYAGMFENRNKWDLTGRHEVDSWVDTWLKDKKLLHMHDPESRELLAKSVSG